MIDNKNKIIVGIIIVVIILAIILVVLSIKKKFNEQQTITEKFLQRVDVDENGVLINDFVVMLKNMAGNYYKDITSGQWKLIERNPNISNDFWIFLTKVTADKISIDPHVLPISPNDTVKEVSIKNNLTSNLAINTNRNMYLYYSPISQYLYPLGTFSMQAVNGHGTTVDLSKVVNIDKIILYSYGAIVHMIKIARSSDFENLFGNYAEYYLFSSVQYGVSAPTTYLSGLFYMVGSGEYKE